MARKKTISESSGYVILLVDDSSDYREATRSLLEREGHAVLTAENGTNALSILKGQKVDLLLLDYYMPPSAPRLSTTKTSVDLRTCRSSLGYPTAAAIRAQAVRWNNRFAG